MPLDESGLSQTTLEKFRYKPPAYSVEWFEGRVARGLSTSTLQRDSQDLHDFNLDLTQASSSDIQNQLAILSRKYSRAGMRRMATIVRQVLRAIDRKDVANDIILPKKGEARVVVYSKDDIEKLELACNSLRDRLLIEILAEVGPRRGELYNMRIKDVQFDEHSAIVWLRGKTGTRTRRLWASKADLVRYLEEHPGRQDPEAKFWIQKNGHPLSYTGLYKILEKLGHRALKRQIFPHAFRHTAATRDSSQYTDREMMLRYGWSSPAMVNVYSHLSARDVDDKDLILHGVKPANDSHEPLIETRICTHCQAQNASVSMYCQNCSAPLHNQETVHRDEADKELRTMLEATRRELAELRNEFRTDTKRRITNIQID